MNKIVLDHYPAAKLPEDLRGSIALNASVRVTVEEEARRQVPIAELIRRTREFQKAGPGVTTEEAVARIRALRDEWDD